MQQNEGEESEGRRIQRAFRRWAPTAVWLATLALFYLPSRAALFELGASDQAGNAVTFAFAIVADFLLWVLVAAFAFWSLANVGRLQSRSTTVALLVSATTGSLVAISMSEGSAWLKAPAVILPVAAIAFVLALKRSYSPDASANLRHLPKLTGGLLLLLSAIPVTALAAWIADDPQRYARRDTQVARAEAEAAAQSELSELERRKRFEVLGPTSRLDDILEFLLTSDEEAGPVLTVARESRSRQSDALRLLEEGRILDLGRLHQLNLTPDRELCAAYREALIESLQPDAVPDTGAPAEPLDYRTHVANIAWLKANGCDVYEIVQLLASMLRARFGETAPPDFMSELEKLSL